MKVLSLFDGMSCGRIALDQLDIPVEEYYASEIDKYAIEVSKANYPDIKHVGSICDLDPKDYMDVDLILAGSPCQGFSFAGKQLAFDDPRSALFFEFIRLLKAIKPKYFLLENVKMKKDFLDIISQQVSECYPEIAFGIEPHLINSSLVSAQNRERYYWTNIPNITQPKERGIVLKDILETVTNDITETYDTPKQVGIATDINGHDILKRVYSPSGKSPTVNTCQGGNREPKVVMGAYRSRSVDKNNKVVAWKKTKPKQMLELRKDEKSNSLTSVLKDNALTKDKVYWRKLTPLEFERLQTVPDNYTNHVSKTQRFKMLGNGWTVEVVKHILEGVR
jgi:DNA-cytosine methyltransferase